MIITLLEQIQEEKIKFLKFGEDPVFLYVGNKEYNEIRSHSTLSGAVSNSLKRNSYCGLEVVRVNRNEFLKVGA